MVSSTHSEYFKGVVHPKLIYSPPLEVVDDSEYTSGVPEVNRIVVLSRKLKKMGETSDRYQNNVYFG